MNRKSLVLVVLLVCLAGALIVFWPTDERRIMVLLREGIEAVESENIDAVMSRVSFNYRDDHGLTYLTLREWVKAQFHVFSEIDVQEGELSVSVSDDRATAVLPARVLATEGSMRGYVVGGPKEPGRLAFVLAREHSRWLIVSCRLTDRHHP
jgi:hypothetical protein